jgi:hypothetical protein
LALGSFQLSMLQFVCDYCRNVKDPAETWINGIAAENVGTQAARREVLIDPTWRRDRAILPFAVHFCSLECKDNYLAELFNRPAALLEVETVEVKAPGQRVIHAKKKPATAAGRKTRVSLKKQSR